jgi:hypothetical protein
VARSSRTANPGIPYANWRDATLGKRPNTGFRIARTFGVKARRVLKVVTSLGYASALVAYATPNVKENYVPSPGNGKGIVVGSMTSNGEYGDFRLMYRQISGGDVQGFFQLNSPTLP